MNVGSICLEIEPVTRPKIRGFRLGRIPVVPVGGRDGWKAGLVLLRRVAFICCLICCDPMDPMRSGRFPFCID